MENIQSKSTIPTISMRAGNTTFVIGLHFSEKTKETMEDKVKKLARNEIKFMEQ